MKFGEYARQQRQLKGLSLRSVAKSLGWSAPYVSDLELGRRHTRKVDKLRKWADFIGVSQQAFIELAARDQYRPCPDCPLKTR